MGRSEPTFVVDECMKETYDPELLTLQVNYLDEQSVRTASGIYKKRNLECWARKDFLLNATARDGTTKTYNFLQYSGTRQLAEDIERVRRVSVLLLCLLFAFIVIYSTNDYTIICLPSYSRFDYSCLAIKSCRYTASVTARQ